MYDHQLFLRTVSDFAGLLLTPYDVDATVQGLSERTTEVFGLAGSGVFLLVEGRVVFDTAVPESLAPLELAQGESQEGPCVQACRTGEVVAVADLARKGEGWDQYRATAAALGIGAVAGIPMSLRNCVVGALNLYSYEPREWSEADLEAVQVLADMCTGLLINGSQVRQQEQLNEQLRLALRTRVVIEQAKGIVAHAHDETVDQAFERLRKHARDRNAPIRAVSEGVVELGLQL